VATVSSAHQRRCGYGAQATPRRSWTAGSGGLTDQHSPRGGVDDNKVGRNGGQEESDGQEGGQGV
jgi:hypothetical protein